MTTNLPYDELKTLKAECIEQPRKYHKLIMWHLEDKYDEYYYSGNLNIDDLIDYFHGCFRVMRELEREITGRI